MGDVPIKTGTLAALKPVVDGLVAAGLHFSVQPEWLLSAQKRAVWVIDWLTAIAGCSNASGRVVADALASLTDVATVAVPASAAPLTSAGVGVRLPASRSPAAAEAIPAPYRSLPEAPLLAPTGTDVSGAAPQGLVDLIRYDAHLPKPVRSVLHQLYITLMRHNAFRLPFGAAFGTAFRELNLRWCRGQGVDRSTVLHLAVQLFTVPTVVTSLVASAEFPAGLMASLWRALAGFCNPLGRSLKAELRSLHQHADGTPHAFSLPKPDVSGKGGGGVPINSADYAFSLGPAPVVAVGLSNRPLAHNKYAEVIQALRYVSRVPGMANAAVKDIPSLTSLVHALRLGQGMAQASRVVGEHVQFESDDWVRAFNLSIQLTASASHLLEAVTAQAPLLLPSTGDSCASGSSSSSASPAVQQQQLPAVMRPLSPAEAAASLSHTASLLLQWCLSRGLVDPADRFIIRRARPLRDRRMSKVQWKAAQRQWRQASLSADEELGSRGSDDSDLSSDDDDGDVIGKGRKGKQQPQKGGLKKGFLLGPSSASSPAPAAVTLPPSHSTPAIAVGLTGTGASSGAGDSTDDDDESDSSLPDLEPSHPRSAMQRYAGATGPSPARGGLPLLPSSPAIGGLAAPVATASSAAAAGSTAAEAAPAVVVPSLPPAPGSFFFGRTLYVSFDPARGPGYLHMPAHRFGGSLAAALALATTAVVAPTGGSGSAFASGGAVGQDVLLLPATSSSSSSSSYVATIRTPHLMLAASALPQQGRVAEIAACLATLQLAGKRRGAIASRIVSPSAAVSASSRLLPTTLALSLLEYPLRALVLDSQYKVGLWVRNGVNISNQHANYTSAPLSAHFYDADILAVQTALACLHPTHGLALLLHKFGLRRFFESGGGAAGENVLTSEVDDDRNIVDGAAGVTRKGLEPAQRLTLLPELLNVLIHLTTELPLLALPQWGAATAPPGAAASVIPRQFVSPPDAQVETSALSAEAGLVQLPLATALSPASTSASSVTSGSVLAAGLSGIDIDEEEDAASAPTAGSSSSVDEPAAKRQRSGPSPAHSSAASPLSFSMPVGAAAAPSAAGTEAVIAFPTYNFSASPSSSSWTQLASAADIASATAALQLRREVVHFLSGGPRPRSALAKLAASVYDGKNKVDEEALTSVLTSVADYRQPSGVLDSGVYVLKDAVLLSEFDPTFRHMKPDRRADAMDVWRNRRKATAYAAASAAPTGGATVSVAAVAAAAAPTLIKVLESARPIVPQPPPVHPAFLPVRSLLHTPGFVHVARVILSEAVQNLNATAASGSTESPKRTPPKVLAASDAAVTSVVHALTLALHTWPDAATNATSSGSASSATSATDLFAAALASSASSLLSLYQPALQRSDISNNSSSASQQAESSSIGSSDAESNSSSTNTHTSTAASDTSSSASFVPSLVSLLYSLHKAEAGGGLPLEVREGCAWLLQRLRHAHPLTSAEASKVLGPDIESAAAAERAAAESARKAEMDAKRKAAQARAMAAMAKQQASFLSKFGDDEDEEEEGESEEGGDEAMVGEGRARRKDESAPSAPPLHPVVKTLLSGLLGQVPPQASATDVTTVEPPPLTPADLPSCASALAAPACILCNASGDDADVTAESGPVAYIALAEGSSTLTSASHQAHATRLTLGRAHKWLQEGPDLSGDNNADRFEIQAGGIGCAVDALRTLPATFSRTPVERVGAMHVVSPVTSEDIRVTAAGLGVKEEDIRAVCESSGYVGVTARDAAIMLQHTDASDADYQLQTRAKSGTVYLPASSPFPLTPFHPGMGLSVSFCGHAAHVGCIQGHLTKSAARPQESTHYLHPTAGEFQCPLCRALSNTLVPHEAALSWPMASLLRGGSSSTAYAGKGRSKQASIVSASQEVTSASAALIERLKSEAVACGLLQPSDSAAPASDSSSAAVEGSGDVVMAEAGSSAPSAAAASSSTPLDALISAARRLVLRAGLGLDVAASLLPPPPQLEAQPPAAVSSPPSANATESAPAAAASTAENASSAQPVGAAATSVAASAPASASLAASSSSTPLPEDSLRYAKKRSAGLLALRRSLGALPFADEETIAAVSSGASSSAGQTKHAKREGLGRVTRALSRRASTALVQHRLLPSAKAKVAAAWEAHGRSEVEDVLTLLTSVSYTLRAAEVAAMAPGGGMNDGHSLTEGGWDEPNPLPAPSSTGAGAGSRTPSTPYKAAASSPATPAASALPSPILPPLSLDASSDATTTSSPQPAANELRRHAGVNAAAVAKHRAALTSLLGMARHAASVLLHPELAPAQQRARAAAGSRSQRGAARPAAMLSLVNLGGAPAGSQPGGVAAATEAGLDALLQPAQPPPPPSLQAAVRARAPRASAAAASGGSGTGAAAAQSAPSAAGGPQPPAPPTAGGSTGGSLTGSLASLLQAASSSAVIPPEDIASAMGMQDPVAALANLLEAYGVPQPPAEIASTGTGDGDLNTTGTSDVSGSTDSSNMPGLIEEHALSASGGAAAAGAADGADVISDDDHGSEEEDDDDLEEGEEDDEHGVDDDDYFNQGEDDMGVSGMGYYESAGEDEDEDEDDEEGPDDGDDDDDDFESVPGLVEDGSSHAPLAQPVAAAAAGAAAGGAAPQQQQQQQGPVFQQTGPGAFTMMLPPINLSLGAGGGAGGGGAGNIGQALTAALQQALGGQGASFGITGGMLAELPAGGAAGGGGGMGNLFQSLMTGLQQAMAQQQGGQGGGGGGGGGGDNAAAAAAGGGANISIGAFPLPPGFAIGGGGAGSFPPLLMGMEGGLGGFVPVGGALGGAAGGLGSPGSEDEEGAGGGGGPMPSEATTDVGMPDLNNIMADFQTIFGGIGAGGGGGGANAAGAGGVGNISGANALASMFANRSRQRSSAGGASASPPSPAAAATIDETAPGSAATWWNAGILPGQYRPEAHHPLRAALARLLGTGRLDLTPPPAPPSVKVAPAAAPADNASQPSQQPETAVTAAAETQPAATAPAASSLTAAPSNTAPSTPRSALANARMTQPSQASPPPPPPPAEQAPSNYDLRLVAAFLTTGGPGPTLTSSEAAEQRRDVSALLPSDAQVLYGHPQAAWARVCLLGCPESTAITLGQVNPLHLLLAGVSVAPTLAHAAHMACLCYAVALSQAANAVATSDRAGGSAMPRAGSVRSAAVAAAHMVEPFVRQACMLLTTLAPPPLAAAASSTSDGASSSPSASSSAAASSAASVSHLVQGFLAFVARFGSHLKGHDSNSNSSTCTGIEDALLVLSHSGLRSSTAADVIADVHAVTLALLATAPYAAGIPALSDAAAEAAASPSSSSSSSQLSVNLRAGLDRLSLIDLPHTYDALYGRLSGQKCERCNTRPGVPALCLVCGVLLCAGGDCCKKEGVGECTRHARVCGGGMGVFLFASTSQVLLMRGEHAIDYPSPYTDAHGEADVGLRRGKPLFLSQRRYGALVELWARNAIGREVAHKRSVADTVYRSGFY